MLLLLLHMDQIVRAGKKRAVTWSQGDIVKTEKKRPQKIPNSVLLQLHGLAADFSSEQLVC